MDTFYKPPTSRDTECRALDENYMNCLMQKALNDKVIVNRCVLDSILWFHLECPKWANAYDDPVEFKRKWRDFFSQIKSTHEATNERLKTPKKI